MTGSGGIREGGEIMATSGTITGAKVKTLWLTFEWKRTAVDIAKNTSTIQWSLKLNSSSSLVFSADKTFTLSIDGQKYDGTFTSNVNWGTSGGNIIIKSGTTVITHGANGKKTFDVNSIFNIAVNISGTMVNSLSLSVAPEILNDIPRATTPTITPSTGVKMGDTIKITLNRASATFTHDLSYKFGDATGVIGDDIEVNTNWLIPRTLANQIPNSASGICQIICLTHGGTKLRIGTTKIEFVLSVNTADIPTIDSVTFEETVIGIKEKFNAFIQGQSKIKLKVNATGVYGSKIASYEVKLMGLTYNKSEFIFDATQGGEVMIQTSVVDTRGKGKDINTNNQHR